MILIEGCWEVVRFPVIPGVQSSSPGDDGPFEAR